jgi:hypothetical protein
MRLGILTGDMVLLLSYQVQRLTEHDVLVTTENVSKCCCSRLVGDHYDGLKCPTLRLFS